MRTAPPGGYDFGKKRDYRRRVWASFRESLKRIGVSIADAQALLMPSLEGDEIDVAVNAGFKQSHLHVVDSEPAIVATLKRRFPFINTYGVAVSRALLRMRGTGIRLHCANLDFCGSVTLPFLRELTLISLIGNLGAKAIHKKHRSSDVDGIQIDGPGFDGIFSDTAFVAVSMLRGREATHWTGQFEAQEEAFSDQAIRDMFQIARDELLNARLEYVGRFKRRVWTEFESNIRQQEQSWLSITQRDRFRIHTVQQALRLVEFAPVLPRVQLVRAGSYLSTSGQTMLWSINQIDSVSSIDRLRVAANAKRRELGLATQPLDVNKQARLYGGLPSEES